MLELFTYTPILKGLIVLVIAGFAFPVTGLYLLRLNLLPLRFMLMHGAILGGAISLAIQLNPFVTTILVNLLIVLAMTRISRHRKIDAGQISAFFMVITISFAFILIYRFNVPAKETLSLMWGSIYTLSWVEVIGMIVFSFLLIAFQFFYRHQLRALFFDREIAQTSGVNERRLYYSIILITAITVAAAMKLIGALLLDALLLLPALIASMHTRSVKSTVVAASLWGGTFAVGGYFLSLFLEIPASSAIASLAAIVFIIILLVSKK